MPLAPKPTRPGDHNYGTHNYLTYDQMQALKPFLEQLREAWERKMRDAQTDREADVFHLRKPGDMDEKTAREHSWWYLDRDERTDGGFGQFGHSKPGPDGLPDYNTQRDKDIERQRDAQRQRSVEDGKKNGTPPPGEPTPVPTEPPPDSVPPPTYDIPEGGWGQQFDNRGGHGIPTGVRGPAGAVALALFLKLYTPKVNAAPGVHGPLK